ncbi:MAG: ribonuclease D [Acidobacteriota bacterium]|nr:ribonuclease D [Acidobacteriota bacterium]
MAPRFRYLVDADDARRAVEAFTGESIVALDTETYWERRANRSRVSLVQIAAHTGAVVIIDALAVDLEILRPLIESPDVAMAAHNARFDEAMLTGEGLTPAAFVDTLRMARLGLHLTSYSLQSVAAHLLGEDVDKSLQKSDWLRRPLTQMQLGYAANDALVTLRVYDELRKIFEAEGRWDEVLRAATLGVKSEGSVPKRKKTVPRDLGPPLTEDEMKIVARLKQWRLAESHARRVPAYMVCADVTLEHLARLQPRTLEDLRGVYGLGESKLARYGESMLKALREAAD